VQTRPFKFEHWPLRQNGRALDDVLEFPHVPRPGVTGQSFQTPSTEPLNWLPDSSRKSAREESDEQSDIRRSLAQRRDVDRKDVQAVQQIGAKLSVADSVIEVPIRGRDDADTHADRLAAPNWFELLLLKDAQQLHLCVEGKLPDFVQKDGAAIGKLESADSFLDRTGERSSDVPEELALNQSRCDRPTVDFHQRPIASPATAMNRPGEQFLARARLYRES